MAENEGEGKVKEEELADDEEYVVKCHVCGKDVPIPPGQRLEVMVPKEPDEYRHNDSRTRKPCGGMGMLCQEAIENRPLRKRKIKKQNSVS